MNTIEQIITNDISSFGKLPKYAAIIGESPSKGARSPILWNAAFKDLGLLCQMVPMDVSTQKLEVLLRELDQDLDFIGGAVAVPYKETVANWLSDLDDERLSHEAQAIGSVNCLYRNSSGILCATNTDGEGAVLSLLSKHENIKGLNAILIGPGGAGKAVAAFVRRAIGRSGRLTISARRPDLFSNFAKRIDASLIEWPPPRKILIDYNIVINCTTIGSKSRVSDGKKTIDLVNHTPLALLNSENDYNSSLALERLPKDTIVFDIIYDPAPTKLLKLAAEKGLQIIDGGMMNLEQAVLAFRYAIGKNSRVDLIRRTMKKAMLSFK